MNAAEALLLAHQRGMIRRPWLPGMLYARHSHPSRPVRLEERDGDPTTIGGHPNWGPVLSDECTLGGFVALVREAVGDPRAGCTFVYSIAAWVVTVRGQEPIESYVGEADAWTQALYRAVGVVDLVGGS